MTSVPRLHKETSIFGGESIAAGFSNTAPKSQAVKRTQRIYWRSDTSMSSWTMPTGWLTAGNDGSNLFGQWTVKVPRLTANADGTGTKYLYLYTCEQREMADGTLAYTTVLLDDSTTVIDGGDIITGSVTANKLDASDINASNSLTVGAFSLETQDGILNSNVDVPTELGQLENDVGYATGEQVSRFFYQEEEPEPPYSVGDLWVTGNDAVKVCAVSKDGEGAYDASDWANADDNDSTVEDLRASIAQARTDSETLVDSAKKELSEDIDKVGDSAQAALEELEGRVTADISKADEWRNYLRFTLEHGLEIGQSGSAEFRQVMDAQGTHWQYEGEDAASVQVDADGKGSMMLARSEVTDQMRIGDYVWINRGDRISLRYAPVGE